MHRLLKVIPFLLLVTMTGCGPNARELGLTTLLMMPIFSALLLLPGMLFDRWLWRPAFWRKPQDRAVPLAMLISGALFAIIAIVFQSHWPGEFGIFLVLAGPSCLALGQLSWLVWRRKTTARPFGLVAFIVSCLWLVLPAIVFTQYKQLGILQSNGHAQDVAAFIWALPGLWGITPTLLFIGTSVYIFKVARPRLRAQSAPNETPNVSPNHSSN